MINFFMIIDQVVFVAFAVHLAFLCLIGKGGHFLAGLVWGGWVAIVTVGFPFPTITMIHSPFLELDNSINSLHV